VTAVRAGNGLTGRAGVPFTAQLRVAVVAGDRRDARPGVVVSFRVLSGPASFAGGARVATAVTDRSGVATAPVLDAGPGTGPVRVTALAAGGVLPATFGLRVIAP
jgi:hypothetical protein